MSVGRILTQGFGSFGGVHFLPTLGFGVGGTRGRSGLGGDDLPRRKSPHRGWDRAEWERLRRDPEQALERTLREAYAALTGETANLSTLAQVDEIVRFVSKPQKKAYIPLQIDWRRLSADFERARALHALWLEEMALQAAIEEEDAEMLLLLS